MEVIAKGSFTYKYRFECKRCLSILQCDREEIRQCSRWTTGLEYDCPICKQTIEVENVYERFMSKVKQLRYRLNEDGTIGEVRRTIRSLRAGITLALSFLYLKGGDDYGKKSQ